jgi:hypothetical protein
MRWEDYDTNAEKHYPATSLLFLQNKYVPYVFNIIITGSWGKPEAWTADALGMRLFTMKECTRDEAKKETIYRLTQILKAAVEEMEGDVKGS